MGQSVVASRPRPRRFPAAFADQSRVAQAFALVGGPIVLGTAAGLVLGLSAAGYWGLQVVATLGGFLAGLEHEGAGEGAQRGIVGGTLFGGTLLIVHALSGWDAHADLGDTPRLLVVVTGVLGCGIGALGAHLRARAVRGLAS